MSDLSIDLQATSPSAGEADVASGAGESPAATHPAVRTLASALAAQFASRNYALPYVARRCRTTESVVQAWLDGTWIPSTTAWNWLRRVDSELGSYHLDQLWGAARDACPELAGEVGPRPAHASPEGRPHRHDRPEYSATPAREPAAGITARIADRWARQIQAIPVVPAPGAEPEAPACEPADPAPPLPPPPQAEIQPEAAPAAPARPRWPSGGDLVRYPCRIARGRLVYLELPADLTLADVERVSAFLRTQADDFQP